MMSCSNNVDDFKWIDCDGLEYNVIPKRKAVVPNVISFDHSPRHCFEYIKCKPPIKIVKTNNK